MNENETFFLTCLRLLFFNFFPPWAIASLHTQGTAWYFIHRRVSLHRNYGRRLRVPRLKVTADISCFYDGAKRSECSPALWGLRLVLGTKGQMNSFRHSRFPRKIMVAGWSRFFGGWWKGARLCMWVSPSVFSHVFTAMHRAIILFPSQSAYWQSLTPRLPWFGKPMKRWRCSRVTSPLLVGACCIRQREEAQSLC